MTDTSLRVLTGLLLGVIAAGIGVMVWFFTRQDNPAPAKSIPQVLQAQDVAVEIPELDVLVVENTPTQDVKKLFSCQGDSCLPLRIPAQAGKEALFSGTTWFFFDEEGALKRYVEGEEATTIVAPTNLVQPRDITISPTGTQVAYWLDNISEEDEEDQRTELWVYDNSTKGTRIVAENLVKADIVSNVRWNKSGTILWFIVDSGEEEEEELEFIVARPEQTGVKAQFLSEDIEALREEFSSGAADMSPSGDALAYVSSKNNRFNVLTVLREGAKKEELPARGVVPYIEWFDEGRLVYAVQSGTNIEFWQWKEGVASPISRNIGMLDSALANSEGEYIAYTVRENLRGASLYILDVYSGRVRLQGKLSAATNTHVAWVQSPHTELRVADATAQYEDAELIAFIEKHATGIAGENTSLKRIVATDSSNMLYIDFEEGEEIKRLLVIVQDIIYPEWTVVGRYESISGQWRRVEGSSTNEPESLRLYEWENPPGQWILKNSF